MIVGGVIQEMSGGGDMPLLSLTIPAFSTSPHASHLVFRSIQAVGGGTVPCRNGFLSGLKKVAALCVPLPGDQPAGIEQHKIVLRVQDGACRLCR